MLTYKKQNEMFTGVILNLGTTGNCSNNFNQRNTFQVRGILLEDWMDI